MAEPRPNANCKTDAGPCPAGGPDRGWTPARVVDLVGRLIPAAAVLSMLFALDDSLRWLGLLGIPLLFLALNRGCPSCSFRRADGATSAWRPFAGH